jgi:ferrous iron transport protein B
MNCHSAGANSDIPADAPVILVGNPNVGKSVIFGRLTGRYVTVSNYPGTTVEIAHGQLPDGTPLIDTPGTNTLNGNSDDERITRNVLLNQHDAIRAVIQVADAKNLCRALLLTFQLTEFGVPLVLSLNMSDEAEAHGISIDANALAEALGIEVIPTVATSGAGLDRLQEAIQRARLPKAIVRYDAGLEAAIADVVALLPIATMQPDRRHLALRLLSGDTDLAAQFSLNGSLTSVSDRLTAQYARPTRVIIVRQQLEAAQSLSEQVTSESNSERRRVVQTLSRLTTHPIWGWPFLLLILFVVYKFVGELGAGTLVGFMEKTVFGQWINPLATQIIDHILPIPFIHDLLVGQYGVITMALSYGIAIVLPIVATFFIAFSILEDTGYLPRLAVMLNWLFKSMGLNGKAVLPMVLGLGCDTMATMTTRILETRKERIMVTLLLALGIPCSAQLGVILGMLGILCVVGVLIWGSVVLATMLAVGLLAAKLLPGERSDFILELPPLRLPRLSNILIKTLARMEWYLKEVLPLFILGTLILFALDKTGALVWIEELAAPLVTGLLGLPKATAGAFLIGFLRRDYGAAGLFALALNGQMNSTQVLVSLIVITLFIPCIANVMIIIKEYGAKVAAGVALVVFPLAFAIGAVVNLGLYLFQITP